MARTRRTSTVKNRPSSRGANSPTGWRPIALVVAGIILLAVVGWYLYDQTQTDATAEHSHGANAAQLEHLHSGGDVELRDIHGMGFSQNGEYLYVAAHDGLRVFTDGEWLLPDLPVNDYMGYTAADVGFYSSGHPGPSSNLVNPLGLVKSTDGGKTLETLGFARESDFHLMAVGYYSHAIYELNFQPNSRLSPGLHYSVDDGKSLQQSASQGLSAQPITMAVHPTEAATVALATEGGLLLSTDYGNTFTPIAAGTPVTAVSFSPVGETLLYGYQTLSAYNLASQQITALTTPAIAAEDAVSYLAVNPAKPDTLALATFNRDLYLSQDGGQDWQPIAQAGQGTQLP